MKEYGQKEGKKRNDEEEDGMGRSPMPFSTRGGQKSLDFLMILTMVSSTSWN